MLSNRSVCLGVSQSVFFGSYSEPAHLGSRHLSTQKGQHCQVLSNRSVCLGVSQSVFFGSYSEPAHLGSHLSTQKGQHCQVLSNRSSCLSGCQSVSLFWQLQRTSPPWESFFHSERSTEFLCLIDGKRIYPGVIFKALI